MDDLYNDIKATKNSSERDKKMAYIRDLFEFFQQGNTKLIIVFEEQLHEISVDSADVQNVQIQSEEENASSKVRAPQLNDVDESRKEDICEEEENSVS